MLIVWIWNSASNKANYSPSMDNMDNTIIVDKCFVYGCPNSGVEHDNTVQFYDFPKDSDIAQQWLTSCCVWQTDEIDLSTGAEDSKQL